MAPWVCRARTGAPATPGAARDGGRVRGQYSDGAVECREVVGVASASPRRDKIVGFVRANPGCSMYAAVKGTSALGRDDPSGWRAVHRAIRLGLLERRDGKLTVPAPREPQGE